MRRRLVTLAAASATMVAVAFVVPLAALVSRVAHDRAIGDAERDVQSVVTGLAVSREFFDIELVITRTASGAEGRLGVYFAVDSVVGAAGPEDGRVEQAFLDRRSWTGSTPDGAAVIVPVALGLDTLVVRADVGTQRLRSGVREAWTWLGAVGLLLVGGSVLVSDRLARNITRPMQELEAVSRKLAAGDLTVRAQPAGPPETAELGRAFNHLAERVDELLLAEREEVADLAHRLRTPLTALRLRLDLVREQETRNELISHVDRLEQSVTGMIQEARWRSSNRAVALDVGDVIRERLQWWTPLAEDSGVVWAARLDDSLPLATLDRDELVAVIDVLIENVFTHVGRGVAKFDVASVEGGVRIRCDDNGPGFDHTAVGRGVSSGSSGLGLDIVRRLAEDGNGTFSVGRNPLGGARVEIWLPGV